MATGGIAIPARTTGNLTRNRYQSKIGGNCGPAQPLPPDSYYLNQCVFHLFQWMYNGIVGDYTNYSPSNETTCEKLLLYYAC